jgi:hypothetical protein
VKPTQASMPCIRQCDTGISPVALRMPMGGGSNIASAFRPRGYRARCSVHRVDHGQRSRHNILDSAAPVHVSIVLLWGRSVVFDASDEASLWRKRGNIFSQYGIVGQSEGSTQAWRKLWGGASGCRRSN